MRLAFVVAAICAGSALVAPAHTEDTKAAKDPNKKICRTERVTGSLLQTNRICMTRAEWDELEVRTRKDIEDTSRHMQVKSSGPFGG